MSMNYCDTFFRFLWYSRKWSIAEYEDIYQILQTFDIKKKYQTKKTDSE